MFGMWQPMSNIEIQLSLTHTHNEPPVGIEPTTIRLRSVWSTNCAKGAIRHVCAYMCVHHTFMTFGP